MSRILVVDDNDEHRYLLRTLLEGNGHTIEEARHGAEALARARRCPPDLAVSDLLMPVLDGYALLRHWRGDARLRRIPFIVYTATYTEPSDERLAIDLGADAFLVKPTEPEVFMTRAESLLAAVRAGTFRAGASAGSGDPSLIESHNTILVRKLEKKAIELEGTNRELTEQIAARADAARALRDSEERYRGLFEAIADPVLVYDRETMRYLLVNDAAVAQYGWTKEEFLGLTALDIRPADQASSFLRMLRESSSARASHGVWKHRRKDGSEFDAEIWAYGLDVGGRPAFLVQVRDISARLRAEAEAARTASLLRAIADGTPDAVFLKDRAGRYLLFNRAAARLVGRPAHEVIGLDDRALFPPDDANVVMANDRLVMEVNDHRTVEETLRTADGVRVFHVRRAPYRDADGSVAGVIGISRDVTDQKRLEDQLRQATKMEAIGRLAGGVAHDFNNLLTIIAGYCELLLAQQPSPRSVRDSVTAIRDAGERAAALTRQLLGFSRQSMIQPRVLALNTVVAETSKMLRRLIGEDILFTTVLAPDLRRVNMDPSQLDQVLMNLAVNARDAMPRGGKLTIETANVELGAQHGAAQPECRAGHHVMLAMSDTGCGMTPEVKARIFEPFFTTKDVGKGTGLGLAMVFGVMQQAGGCIHVYSEPGVGTTFKLYFPAVTEEPGVATAAAADADLPGTETILLVEDDAAVRRLALASLEMYGYRVLSARDGRDALRVAAESGGPIDLVLTDVVMPHMSGPELAAALRVRSPGTKVLFMSGYTDDAVIRHGLLGSDVEFIQKPYTPVSLARRVREVLRGSPPAA